MTLSDVSKLRLHNLMVTSRIFDTPAALVKYIGGLQAQDYSQSKWAIASRLTGEATDKKIEEAISERSIIRTWPMRGTIHIISSDDYYWIMDLLGPLNINAMRPGNLQLELDEKVLDKSINLISTALKGKKELTREELSDILAKGNIQSDGQRLSHILNFAGQRKILCFGKRKGKKFTYTFVQDWIKPNKAIDRDEAISLLAKMFFQSRGPATLQDFVWWSGLPVKDAKKGLELIKKDFEEIKIQDQFYWHRGVPDNYLKNSSVLLLAAFDEFLMSYKDRTACLKSSDVKNVFSKNGIFYPVVVDDGKIVAVWKREILKNKVDINIQFFEKPAKTFKDRIESAAEEYAKFLAADLGDIKYNF